MSEKVRTPHLERKAILYVRQSSPYQVIHNLESQKLQYAMEARLRQLGWREIGVRSPEYRGMYSLSRQRMTIGEQVRGAASRRRAARGRVAPV